MRDLPEERFPNAEYLILGPGRSLLTASNNNIEINKLDYVFKHMIGFNIKYYIIIEYFNNNNYII